MAGLALDSLSSRDVHCCYVEIDGSVVRCGILTLNEDFEPGTHTLYGSDGLVYEVAIATDEPVTYSAELHLVGMVR